MLLYSTIRLLQHSQATLLPVRGCEKRCKDTKKILTGNLLNDFSQNFLIYGDFLSDFL